MEDMARLALVEQNVKDVKKFNNILHELLKHINNILENPHENNIRTIKSDTLIELLNCNAFCDYLKYVGFQTAKNEFTFPKEETLSKLRVAQAAIEKKLSFCYGPRRSVSLQNITKRRKTPQILPANILASQNPFLQKIQQLFNDMLNYEDEELQQLAREHIPLVTLQLMALDRMREQQRKIKTGEIKGRDMTFDIALLMELLGWFKHKFFTWVDEPPCDRCGNSTKLLSTTTMKTDTEICRVELYKCESCTTTTRFPRYNDPRALLRSRRGRCGEWAHCFTLLCRALGYETRYVYDVTDHVWCEVFDYDANGWLHVDPCEGLLGAPLVYSHGWGKRLSYVVAVCKDDLQDVTWRYTTDHKEVLKRRAASGRVSEEELLRAILGLRAHRHAQLSAPRRAFLQRRALRELVDLMAERKPSDYESHGRVSGSKAWKTSRGEVGDTGYVFEFQTPGEHGVSYSAASDIYRVTNDQKEVKGWLTGVYRSENVFRKVEKDWKQVYLARTEGDEVGTVSWMLSTSGDKTFDLLEIKGKTALYDSGKVEWSVQFDSETSIPAEIGESPVQFSRKFKRVMIKATLKGGSGDVSWQHAQLFRQPSDDVTPTFYIRANLCEH